MSTSIIRQSLDLGKRIAEDVLWPVVALAVRLVGAYTFFPAGGEKLNHLPELCAAAAVGFSALLALGLFGRVSALGLCVMTGFAYYSADAESPALYGALLCAVIVAKGPGAISVDRFVFRGK